MEIRDAQSSDGPGFLELVQCLADYEKLPGPDEGARVRLLDHAFGTTPKFRLLVAADGDRIVAYAAWFMTYSTFRARPSLFLEDLFVHPGVRRRGLATKMMTHLRKRALELEAGRFEWTVLDWNQDAQALYEGLGAKRLDGWQIMRMDLEPAAG
jgi:GNAT superfamily N-acetyltransferase